MTRQAVIVSTARTPIGRAYLGAFNDTDANIGRACNCQPVKRAGIDSAEVDDVIMGCAMQQGSSGQNIGEHSHSRGTSKLRIGNEYRPPVFIRDVSDCDCCKTNCHDHMPITVGGGLESISLVQNEHRNAYRAQDPNVIANPSTLTCPC